MTQAVAPPDSVYNYAGALAGLPDADFPEWAPPPQAPPPAALPPMSAPVNVPSRTTYSAPARQAPPSSVMTAANFNRPVSKPILGIGGAPIMGALIGGLTAGAMGPVGIGLGMLSGYQRGRQDQKVTNGFQEMTGFNPMANDPISSLADSFYDKNGFMADEFTEAAMGMPGIGRGGSGLVQENRAIRERYLRMQPQNYGATAGPASLSTMAAQPIPRSKPSSGLGGAPRGSEGAAGFSGDSGYSGGGTTFGSGGMSGQGGIGSGTGGRTTASDRQQAARDEINYADRGD